MLDGPETDALWTNSSARGVAQVRHASSGAKYFVAEVVKVTGFRHWQMFDQFHTAVAWSQAIISDGPGDRRRRALATQSVGNPDRTAPIRPR